MRRRHVLAAGFGVISHKVVGRPTPLNVMVSVTDRCTARCGYCAIPERRTPEPTTVELLGLVERLAARGARRVGFWGGEPLLRADLPQVLRRCRELGLWTSIDTNGHLFARRVDELDALDHVVFSLDGRRDAHDAVRGSGSWERVLAGLHAARGRGIPHWTLTVLGAHNLDEVGWLVDLAEEHGHLAAFQVLHHPESLDGGKARALEADELALRRVLRRLLEWRRAGRPVANSPGQLRHLLDWPDLAEATSPDRRGAPCVAGELYCNVDTDGRVYPCSLLIGQVPALSAYEVGFDKAFAEVAEPPCRSCTATCFTEYNALLSLRPAAVAWWVRTVARPSGPDVRR